MTAHNCNVLPFPGIFIPRRLHLTRKKNADYRSREYLTEAEVEQLMVAASRVGRHGHRDATLILMAYRHGLRVTELVKLRWDQVELEGGSCTRTASRKAIHACNRCVKQN